MIQEDPCEYALVYHKHIQNPPVSGKKLPEYEASIIIAHNHYPGEYIYLPVSEYIYLPVSISTSL